MPRQKFNHPPEASQSISTIGLPCTLAIGDGMPAFGGPAPSAMATGSARASWPASGSSLFPPLEMEANDEEFEPGEDQLEELSNKIKRAEASIGEKTTEDTT